MKNLTTNHMKKNSSQKAFPNHLLIKTCSLFSIFHTKYLWRIQPLMDDQHHLWPRWSVPRSDQAYRCPGSRERASELRILGVVGARRCERAWAVNAPEQSRECRAVSSESACARTGARIMYVTVTPFRVLSSLPPPTNSPSNPRYHSLYVPLSRSLSFPLSLSHLSSPLLLSPPPSLFPSVFPCSSFPVFVVPLAAVRPWEQIHSPSPTRTPPLPPKGTFHPPPRWYGRALRSLAPRPRRVYIPHSPYLHLYRLASRCMHACTDAYARRPASRAANSLLSRKIKANTTGERDAGHSRSFDRVNASRANSFGRVDALFFRRVE